MKIPPISYSFHRNWKTCPRQAWHVNIAKDVQIEQSAAIVWGNRVHELFEKRINNNEPFPEGIRRYEDYARFPAGYVVAAELKLGMTKARKPCDFFAEECWARGVLDVVLRHTSNNKVALIIDHKTGKKREDPAELRMHAVLLAANNPSLNDIRGWYNWLKTNEMGVVYDLSDVDETYREMVEVRNRVEHAAMLGEHAFMPKQGPLCPWCPVKDCELHP